MIPLSNPTMIVETCLTNWSIVMMTAFLIWCPTFRLIRIWSTWMLVWRVRRIGINRPIWSRRTWRHGSIVTCWHFFVLGEMICIQRTTWTLIICLVARMVWCVVIFNGDWSGIISCWPRPQLFDSVMFSILGWVMPHLMVWVEWSWWIWPRCLASGWIGI